MLVGFGRAIAKSLLTCSLAPHWCIQTLWKCYPHLKPKPEEMEVQFARQVYMLQSTIGDTSPLRRASPGASVSIRTMCSRS